MAKKTSHSPQPNTASQPPHLDVRRTDDFRSRYANNARFETYLSDLKILFGQSDQASGHEVIEQHTAITLTWENAKLLIYYLQANLAIREVMNGEVMIPPGLNPPPPAPPEGNLKDDPTAQAIFSAISKIHSGFFKTS